MRTFIFGDFDTTLSHTVPHCITLRSHTHRERERERGRDTHTHARTHANLTPPKIKHTSSYTHNQPYTDFDDDNDGTGDLYKGYGMYKAIKMKPGAYLCE
jgi:hypothetical protein